MIDKLIIYKLNDVYLKIDCSMSVAKELYEYFSFYVPGYKFMPAYRNKIWNGQIKLFDLNKHTLYFGLLQYVIKFASNRDYEIVYDENFKNGSSFTIDDCNHFIKDINLKIEPRDYQIDAVTHAIQNDRAVLLSPTGSGKSLIIFLLTKWYDCRTLIIVPTVSLTQQMYSDFHSYDKQWNINKDVHIIMQGREKISDKKIVISTWQSIFKMPKSFFDNYDLIIGDEAHLFKAKSLTSIMTKMINCRYRFGTTGTLDDTQTHKLVLEGLFGPVYNVTSTKKLIEEKHLANFDIKCIILKYSEDISKQCKGMKYQEEMDFIVNYEKRNKFICNLAIDQKGNTLLLFQYVEKHGKILYDLIKNKVDSDRKVFMVYGGVDSQTREDIRKITEDQHNAIIVASFGTFSTGVNIKNLHNIIFASPSKSKIRNLQSIGRGLRKSDSKDKATLFDIADDLKYKSYQNYTIQHFSERIKQYLEQEFEYKIYNIDI